MEMFNFFLFLHIAGGSIGLIAGSYIMLAKKGDKRHKLIGKIFAISMLGAGICSLILASIHRSDFLFAVGIFTIYMVGTGWRYLKLKDILKEQKPKIIDWMLMIFMILGCIRFAILGIKSILASQYFGAIILIFAWRGISFVMQDFKTFNKNIEIENYWLILHLQRMIGAYIASFTAFAVVNAPNELSFMPWILPSVLFVPYIIKWSKKYTIKRELKSDDKM